MNSQVVINSENMLNHSILNKDLIFPADFIERLQYRYKMKMLSDYQTYICERLNSNLYKKKKINTPSGRSAYLLTYADNKNDDRKNECFLRVL